MILEKIAKSFPVLLFGLSLVLLSAGFAGRACWGAPAGVSAEGAGSERNPFAYPQRIMKELASLPKSGDGKTPAAAKTPQMEYALSGILWTDKGGVASINRRIVQEGEMLDGYRVFRIDRNKVVLKKEGEEMVLNLFQSPVVITEPRDHHPPTKKKF